MSHLQRLRVPRIIGHQRDPVRYIGPGLPAGGFALVAQDDFQSYADGALLGQAASGTTANWTHIVQGPITVKDYSGQKALTCSDACIVQFTGASFSADQRVEMTLRGVGVGDIGPAVRIRASDYSWYEVKYMSTGELKVFEWISGVTQHEILGTALSMVAGDSLAISVTGEGAATRLRVEVKRPGFFADNWYCPDESSFGSITPTNFVAGTNPPGVASYGNAGGAARAGDWKGYSYFA